MHKLKEVLNVVLKGLKFTSPLSEHLVQSTLHPKTQQLHTVTIPMQNFLTLSLMLESSSTDVRGAVERESARKSGRKKVSRRARNVFFSLLRYVRQRAMRPADTG